MGSGPFFPSILILETYQTSDIADLPTGPAFADNTSTGPGAKPYGFRESDLQMHANSDPSRYWTRRASEPVKNRRKPGAGVPEKPENPGATTASRRSR